MKKDVTPLTPLESNAPKLSKPKNSAAGIPAANNFSENSTPSTSPVSYTHLTLPTKA